MQKIEKIPAEEIKKAMAQVDIEDPVEEMVSIATSAFEFISSIEPDKKVDMDMINAFYALNRQFKLYAKLAGY